MTKVCITCKLEKNIVEFSKNSSKKDGLHNKCKLCHSLYYKKYYKVVTEKQPSNLIGRLALANSIGRVPAF